MQQSLKALFKEVNFLGLFWNLGISTASTALLLCRYGLVSKKATIWQLKKFQIGDKRL